MLLEFGAPPRGYRCGLSWFGPPVRGTSYRCRKACNRCLPSISSSCMWPRPTTKRSAVETLIGQPFLLAMVLGSRFEGSRAGVANQLADSDQPGTLCRSRPGGGLFVALLWQTSEPLASSAYSIQQDPPDDGTLWPDPAYGNRPFRRLSSCDAVRSGAGRAPQATKTGATTILTPEDASAWGVQVEILVEVPQSSRRTEVGHIETTRHRQLR